jgi:hypothetical protein
MGDAGRTPGRGGLAGLRPGAGPRPLGALADLAELVEGESDRSRHLLGGLAAGALVGAAIAGTLLRLRSARARRDA